MASNQSAQVAELLTEAASAPPRQRGRNGVNDHLNNAGSALDRAAEGIARMIKAELGRGKTSFDLRLPIPRGMLAVSPRKRAIAKLALASAVVRLHGQDQDLSQLTQITLNGEELFEPAAFLAAHAAEKAALAKPLDE